MDQIRNIVWREYNSTQLSPIALIFIIIMALVVLNCNKRYVVLPFIATACFITFVQRIVIFNADFNMIRLLVLVVGLRMILRKDYCAVELKNIEKYLICYVIISSVAYILLWKTSGAVINRLGFAFDAIGIFFVTRFYVRDLEDISLMIRFMIFTSILLAITMTIEQVTHYNFFSIFGGVASETLIRDGKLRASGPFSHPIMAGTFGALLFPLCWGLMSFNKDKYKKIAYVGFFSALVIILASKSSGPIMSFGAALFAISMWYMRHYLKSYIKWFLVFLITVHFLSRHPVWHLLARIDLVGGSTGYHRFMLIDQAISRWHEWFFVGIRSSAHWGWGMQDVTNMYVLQAVRGGVGSLVLFLMIISASFKKISTGLVVKSFKENEQMFIWAIGSLMFVHVISFIGVSYFGQMDFFWYLTIALIAIVGDFCQRVSEENMELLSEQ